MITAPRLKPLTKFAGLRKQITRECLDCGDIRSVTARSLLETGTCIVCVSKARAKQLRKPPEVFEKQMSAIFPHYILLTPYVSNDKKITVLCTLDDNIFNTVPHSLLDGHGCPECARRKQNRRTHQEFVLEMAERYPLISILSEFVNTYTPVRFRCLVCQYEWAAVPNTLLNRCKSESGCPKCAGKAKATEKELIQRLSESGSDIEYVSGFVNMASKAVFKCKKCGETWEAFVNNVLRRLNCAVCDKSCGNKAVASYLKRHGVTFETEYRFGDCKDKRTLPFDFYLPDLNCCIEYDGEQHFRPVRFGSYGMDVAIKKFGETRKRDEIKTNYCANNGIQLIRIPYTDFNKIETILDKSLS